jgi:hypothetical protein
MDFERNEVIEGWVKGAVFWQEVERCRLAMRYSGRASKDARQTAWVHVADAPAVEDEELVAAVAAAAAAVVAEAAVEDFAETEACCATWLRQCRCGREEG